MKITATVYKETTPDFIEAEVTGYEVEAWGAKMIVTKSLGFWQVYDIDSRMSAVGNHKTKKSALEKLRQAEQDISTERYQEATRYWKHRQGRLAESEQSISFGLNKARLGSL